MPLKEISCDMKVIMINNMIIFSMYKLWFSCSTNYHFLKAIPIFATSWVVGQLEIHNLKFVNFVVYGIFESQQTFIQHLCENFDSMSQMQMVVL
jgi:hypothetical protein